MSYFSAISAILNAEGVLGGGDVSVSDDDITLKLWMIVIQCIFSNVVPLGLGVGSSHDELMT